MSGAVLRRAEGEGGAPRVISPACDLVSAAMAGETFILAETDEIGGRGMLVASAEAADAAVINFMAMHGRGLICLALTPGRAHELGLALMARRGRPACGMDFTVSVEARTGVSTGISAHDRAATIAVLMDPRSSRDDLVSPGHVFPVVTRDGGVLARAALAEAAVDIMRVAGREPAAAICEVLAEDGGVARLPDLQIFARRHGLKVGVVDDLVRLRRGEMSAAPFG